jgi:hypothetical protein
MKAPLTHVSRFSSFNSFLSELKTLIIYFLAWLTDNISQKRFKGTEMMLGMHLVFCGFSIYYIVTFQEYRPFLTAPKPHGFSRKVSCIYKTTVQDSNLMSPSILLSKLQVLQPSCDRRRILKELNVSPSSVVPKNVSSLELSHSMVSSCYAFCRLFAQSKPFQVWKENNIEGNRSKWKDVLKLTFTLSRKQGKDWMDWRPSWLEGIHRETQETCQSKQTQQ